MSIRALLRRAQAASDSKVRRQAFTEAWQAVDRAVRPLGTECGQSPWNAGYTQARDEAQNAILELRDRA